MDGMDVRSRGIRALRESGIFDAPWYAARHADVGHSDEDPHEHDVDHGGREGRQPNLYLDPA